MNPDGSTHPFQKTNCKMKKTLAGLLLLASIYSCSNNHKAGEADDSATPAVMLSAADTLHYHYDSVKVAGKTPVSANKQASGTVRAEIVFPVFSNKAAGKFIEAAVISLSGKQVLYASYRDMAAGFVREFELYKSEGPPSKESWHQRVQMKVAANYPTYLSVLLNDDEYRGGARPTTLLSYFNYNPQTSQTITLDSLITTEGMPKLTTVGEAIFRANENLAANTPLSGKYSFVEGKFSLPYTFTVTREGIKFLYNPAEIKPYAAGPTTLLIPFSKIKDIMKESSILTNFKHNGSI